MSGPDRGYTATTPGGTILYQTLFHCTDGDGDCLYVSLPTGNADPPGALLMTAWDHNDPDEVSQVWLSPAQQDRLLTVLAAERATFNDLSDVEEFLRAE